MGFDLIWGCIKVFLFKHLILYIRLFMKSINVSAEKNLGGGTKQFCPNFVTFVQIMIF